MKNHHFLRFLLVFSLFIYFNSLSGQENIDSIGHFKNTIRTNISNPMLFGTEYNVIGYERLLKNNQSVSVNIGRFSLPKFESYYSDSLDLNNNYEDKGFTFAIDYRFYLKKENRYPAPKGVYFGPYYSYNYFNRKNSWEMNSDFIGTVNSDMTMHINLVGIQMGYQFVIKNRLSIDLVFGGPGLWFYNVNTTLNTTLGPEDESLLFEQLNDFLASKLPGHEILIEPGQLEKNGTVRAVSMGFRYVLNIGYRFNLLKN